MLENFRSRAALARFLIPAATGVAADLLTKWWAFSALGYYVDGQLRTRVVEAIPGWLHFEVTTNRGAVFGMGQGGVPVFLVISILAVGFLLYLFAASGSQRLQQVLLGVLLAGVLGNMYDRLVFGHVRDMIHILPRWGVFPWIFNLADSLLCVGVAVMLAQGFRQSRGQCGQASG